MLLFRTHPTCSLSGFTPSDSIPRIRPFRPMTWITVVFSNQQEADARICLAEARRKIARAMSVTGRRRKIGFGKNGRTEAGNI